MIQKIPRSIIVTIELERETHQLHLRKDASESELHVVLKILAYIYFWDREYIIEPDFHFHGFKPDLLLWRDSEIPNLAERTIDSWIECKVVKPKKLQKLGKAITHGTVFWFHDAKVIQQAVKNTYSKRKWKLSPSVKLIGVKMEQGAWRALQTSLTIKNAGWIVEKYNRSEISIKLDNGLPTVYPVEFLVICGTKVHTRHSGSANNT